MPTYHYRASTATGKIKKGKHESYDENLLREQLSSNGLHLLDFSVSDDETQDKKLKTVEIAEFCRQLSAMLSAGVPLIRSVKIMLGRDMNSRVRSVYTSIYSALQRGEPLSSALETNGSFPSLLVNAFRASESSGQMDKTAARMAIQYEKEHRLNSRIKSAAFYPLILLCLTVIIVLLVFNFVLPRFFTLFEGIELPGPTRFVLAISNALRDYGTVILIAILAFVLGISFLIRIPAVKLFLDKLKLSLPVVGKLLKVIYTSRFARTLSALYSSGLTILNALQCTRDTIGNTYIASQFDFLLSEVSNGESLSNAISKVDGFDTKLASTIAIGEESGNLDYMLTSIAESFDYDSEQAMTRLTALVEPIMIIIMAVIIGFVMISVMLPILSLYSNLGEGYGL
ncbi:MAG: type II secretion system F family protein [Oscillospiraceae bacterium]